MKTIEVTDEQFEALMHMAELMHTQDNRITANPIFCVYKKFEHPDEDGSESKFINCDGDEIFSTEEELLAAFRDKKEFLDYHDLVTEEEYDAIDNDSMFAVGEICELLELRHVHYYMDTEAVTGQYYFTEEACHKHIKANNYHYNEPHSFVESAWRNPEMQLLREVVMSLVKKEEVPA